MPRRSPRGIRLVAIAEEEDEGLAACVLEVHRWQHDAPRCDWPITDDAVLDRTAEKFIEYLEPRRVENYLFGEEFSLVVEDYEHD